VIDDENSFAFDPDPSRASELVEGFGHRLTSAPEQIGYALVRPARRPCRSWATSGGKQEVRDA